MYAKTLLDDHLAATAAYSGEPVIFDSFAGGGGASTGIEMALGRSPDIAINHNAAALALHAANHPETLHVSENVYRVDPLDYLAGRHVGLAWFSPDCKHFSKAKGGKPVERNIRDLAWIIPGWIERIQKSGGRVDVVIMENVEEFSGWGPLIQTDKGLMPDPDRKGTTFELWCRKLKKLGGRIEMRELKAYKYGAPTIRKRLFIIIRFDGKPIVWPDETHDEPGNADVIAGAKLPWRTAAEIIDWSIPCPSIFDSAAEIHAKFGLRSVRPLADNTMARLARGTKRYVLDAEEPFLVSIAHGDSGGRREYPLDEPFGVVTAGGISHAICSPSVTRFNSGATGQDCREPLSTVTANSFIKRPGAAAPLGIVAPHLSAFYGPGDGGQDRSADLDDPLRTVTTENRHAVVAPVLSYAQQGGGNRSVDEPVHTICASDKDQNQVIVPVLVGCGGRAGQSRPRSGDEPMATITAKADTCVAAAVLVQTGYGERQGQEPRALDPDKPLGTIVAGGIKHAAATAFLAQNNYSEPGHDVREPLSTIVGKGCTQSVVQPFISRQFGTSTGHDIESPLGTITADGQGKSALIAPYMQKYYGTGDGARYDEPCHTVTVKDRHGHVEILLDLPPFTPDMKDRARKVADFLRAHGYWDDREFVTFEISGVAVVMVDIGMRMLTPRELYNAQGFPPDYEIEHGLDGTPFSKSVQVSCVGNSVCPPVAAALVGANCGHLARMREAAE